jgi:hypothetical protein
VSKRLRVGKTALTAGLFYHHAEALFFVFVASFTQPIAGLLLEVAQSRSDLAKNAPSIADNRARSCTQYERGSIYGVGRRFQACRIHDLEMVDQTSASWHRVTNWLRHLDQLRFAG